jgi:hypothetical protein
MNISIKARIVAMLASIVVTTVLFDAVASMAQPTPEPALRLASVATVR